MIDCGHGTEMKVITSSSIFSGTSVVVESVSKDGNGISSFHLTSPPKQTPTSKAKKKL